MDSAANSINVSSIPEEILVKIFENLNGNDIKSVKMVCKNWFQATKNRKIGSKLKLKFSCVSSKSELDFFKSSSQNFYNVEINGFSINIFVPFFKAMGKSIKSIQLTNMHFNSDTELKKILNFMESLHELELLNCIFAKTNGVDFSEVFLNLKIIKIIPHVDDNLWFESQTLKNILSSLPKNGIVSFTLNLLGCHLLNEDENESVMPQLLLSVIKSNRRTLNELSLEYLNGDEFWEELKNCNCTLKSFSLKNSTPPSNVFMDFLLTQKNLTCLRLDSLNKVVDNANMKLIVDNLQNIETIELCIALDWISNELICSLNKLKSLKKITINGILDRDQEFLHGFTGNENLNFIKLDLTSIYFTLETFQNIIKKCPNLEILKCHSIIYFTEEEINKVEVINKFWEILENLPNLKELCWINNICLLPMSNNENLLVNINIKNTLKNLEILEISNLRHYIAVFEDINLPNLKVLRMVRDHVFNSDDDNADDVIPIFFQKCKAIQHLEITKPMQMCETVDAIIENFPNLKSIQFFWSCKNKDCKKCEQDLIGDEYRIQQVIIQNDQHVTKRLLIQSNCFNCKNFDFSANILDNGARLKGLHIYKENDLFY